VSENVRKNGKLRKHSAKKLGETGGDGGGNGTRGSHGARRPGTEFPGRWWHSLVLRTTNNVHDDVPDDLGARLVCLRINFDSSSR